MDIMSRGVETDRQTDWLNGWQSMEQSVLNYDSCLPCQDIAHFSPVF